MAPMNTVQFDLGDFSCEMTFDNTVILGHLARAAFKILFAALKEFHAVVPLASYSFGPAVGENEFTYQFTALDGRMWSQVLDFTDRESDPAMIFTVADKWRDSEFKFNRPVRDQMVALHASAGLETFEATFGS